MGGSVANSFLGSSLMDWTSLKRVKCLSPAFLKLVSHSKLTDHMKGGLETNFLSLPVLAVMKERSRQDKSRIHKRTVGLSLFGFDFKQKTCLHVWLKLNLTTDLIRRRPYLWSVTKKESLLISSFTRHVLISMKPFLSYVPSDIRGTYYHIVWNHARRY